MYYKFWSFQQGGWNERIVKNADVSSFYKIETEEIIYGKDKLNVYYKNKIIQGADPKTFKYIKKGFAVDAKRVYYYADSITNSSPREFEIIDIDFSKDYKNVFYKTKPLEVCSVKDFTFVFEDEENILGRWSTDGCDYYFNNYKVPSNDYQNITVYKGSNGISKDTKFVYIRDEKYFATNKRTLFLKEKGRIVEDSIDIETFRIENNILKDKFGNINGFY